MGPGCLFARKSRLRGQPPPRRQSPHRIRGVKTSEAEPYREGGAYPCGPRRWPLLRFLKIAGAAGGSVPGAVNSDRAPHALHRTTTLRPSSVKPTISVRWLPHLGQMDGGFGISICDWP